MQLIVQNIEYHRQEEAVFKPVSFQLNKGESVLVEGPNGAGKTTLLRLISGILTPTHGTITHQNQQTPCHLIGHQDGVKSALTTTENLNFWAHILQSPKKNTIKQKTIRDTLSQIQIQPNKYAKNLSAGQKRRLAIARLILIKKPLWILDEPFSVLDQKWTQFLEETIQNHLNHGGMVILASHKKPKSPFTYTIKLPIAHIRKNAENT